MFVNVTDVVRLCVACTRPVRQHDMVADIGHEPPKIYHRSCMPPWAVIEGSVELKGNP